MISHKGEKFPYWVTLGDIKFILSDPGGHCWLLIMEGLLYIGQMGFPTMRDPLCSKDKVLEKKPWMMVSALSSVQGGQNLQCGHWRLGWWQMLLLPGQSENEGGLLWPRHLPQRLVRGDPLAFGTAQRWCLSHSAHYTLLRCGMGACKCPSLLLLVDGEAIPLLQGALLLGMNFTFPSVYTGITIIIIGFIYEKYVCLTYNVDYWSINMYMIDIR